MFSEYQKSSMYYLIKQDGVYKVHEVSEPTTDATYLELKKEGYDVQGQYGRKDYAEIWKDYYNGNINRKELRNRLKL